VRSCGYCLTNRPRWQLQPLITFFLKRAFTNKFVNKGWMDGVCELGVMASHCISVFRLPHTLEASQQTFERT